MVKIAIIGLGGRGLFDYAPYALQNPSEVQIVAVADPKENMRKKAIELYKIDEKNVFNSWQEMLDREPIADGLLICTQDNMHYEPVMKALEIGYKNILLEKPISAIQTECEDIARFAKEKEAKVVVCHSLRYTSFYRKLKEIIDSGIIGDVVSIQHIEGVSYFHFAHSYVRGDWGNTKKSSPLIMAKCCHDMDLMIYLLGKNCKSVSSFGSLTHFKEENAPEGSSERCVDCNQKLTCPYNALDIYTRLDVFRRLAVDKEGFSDFSDAMKNGRYGRCVYRCDNDALDHQVVNMLFEDGVTVSFTVCAYSEGRETLVMGTKGNIRANLDASEIFVDDFATKDKTKYNIYRLPSGHSGADTVMMHDFVDMIANGTECLSDIEVSIQSHAICHAVEKSRLNGEVVKL